MRDHVPAAEMAGIPDEFVEREPNRGVVRGHNRARARANDHVDGDVVSDQLFKNSDVASATKPSAAQNKGDTRSRVRSLCVRRVAELCEQRRCTGRSLVG